MKETKIKKGKGITLIALIITIIIMLILVAVSINILIKSDLFGTAQRAGDRTRTAYNEEGTMGEITIGNKTYSSIEEYLNKDKVDIAAKEKELKEKLAKETGNSAIDEYGNIVDVLMWKYRILNEEEKTCEIRGNGDQYGYDLAYNGEFTDYGTLEENIPMFIKISDNIYKVTSIGQESFLNCTNLTSIEIPSNVEKIDMYAFSGCTSLRNVNLPNGLQLIEFGAFSRCSSLTNIFIPESVVSLGENVFYGCAKLNSVNIPRTQKRLSSGLFGYCSSLRNVDLPEGLEVIDSFAFGGCSSLSSVVVPDGVTELRRGAFEDCTSLTNIEIPNSVSEISFDVFHGTAWYNNQPDGLLIINSILVELKGQAPEDGRITIPDGVTSISFGALEEAVGMKSVVIPITVKSIGWYNFSAANLTDVYYGGSENDWAEVTIGDFGNERLTNATIHYNYTGE